VVIRTLVEPGLYRDGARPLPAWACAPRLPGHHPRSVPQKRGAAPTFEDVAEAYMAERPRNVYGSGFVAGSGGGADRTYPVVGRKPVNTIDINRMLAVLKLV
jgi:hypothetical protein